MQLELLTVPEPEQPEGTDLRLCSCEELLDSLEEAPALIVADPPWSYSNDTSGLISSNREDGQTYLAPTLEGMRAIKPYIQAMKAKA